MAQPSLARRLELSERPQGRSPVMFQKWRDLLFLHWAYDPDEIQRTLPAGLYVDTFDARAWVGIVPFFMRDVRPRFVPPVPGISDFLELNVRTYVHDGQGTAGVWFYSLDANQWLAVKLARLFFRLPYFHAAMEAGKRGTDGEVTYASRRRGAEVGSRFGYRGDGAVRHAEPGSLAFFLIERYVLFAHSARDDRLLTGRVHHVPYPLRDAHVSEWDDRVLALDGLRSTGRPPDHVVMSGGVEVEIFAPQSVTA